MKLFKRMVSQHPYLFILVIFPLIPYLLFVIQLFIARQFSVNLSGQEYLQHSTKITTLVIYGLILWRYGWLRPAGFQSLGNWRVWMIMIAGLVYELIFTILLIDGHFEWRDLTVMADPFAYLLVGLFEEVAFRGLILFALLHTWGDTRRGMVKSVIVSSMLFGIMHITTILTGNSISGALYQVAGSILSGVWFSLLVLYGRSIWPAIISHFLVDAIGNANLQFVTDFSQANLFAFLVQFPLLVLAVFLFTRIPQKIDHTKPPPSGVISAYIDFKDTG